MTAPKRWRHGRTREVLGIAALAASAALGGCSAPDALPQRTSAAPPGRPVDDLLERPALQAVVEATLARDADRLVEALGDADPQVRARAAFGLGSVQDPAARAALERLLGDPDARVREDAAFALGQIEGGVGEAVQVAVGTEEDPRVRRALVEAIGKRGGTEALRALYAVDDAEHLEAATLALSRGVIRGTAPDDAVDTLIARMRHADPDVRAAAAYVTARAEAMPAWGTRYREVAEVLDGYQADDEAAMHLLVGLGRAVTVFTQPVDLDWVFVPDDWRIRANAAVAATATYEARPQTGPLLLAALDDPSPHVRQRAAEGLGAVPASPEVRRGILARVARDPDDRAMVGPLLPLLTRTGEVELVRRYLEEIPPHDRGGWVQAREALDQLPAPFAVQELAAVVRMPNAPDTVAVDAAWSLREMWGVGRTYPEVVQYFRPALDSAVRQAAPRRVIPLARVLADSVLLDHGSADVLAALLARTEGTDAHDRIVEEIAGSDDPRVDSLLGRRDAEAADSASTADGERASVVSGPEADDPVLEVDWPALQALGAHPRWVLETDRGRVVVVLRTGEAPLTVQMIARLTREGRYDGVPFHRVIPNFVAQGGDVERADGTGGPGFVIRSEFTRTPFLRGVVGMASSGKDTEGSQFFITHSPQWHLDGAYTAFGWVEEGMSVVDRIVRGDRVLRARIVPVN